MTRIGLPGDVTIYLGDFNVDYKKIATDTRSTAKALRDWKSTNSLVQIIEETTWLRSYPDGVRSSLLDHCYLSDISKVISSGCLESHVSDHDPIFVEIQTPEETNGGGSFWTRNWKGYTPETLNLWLTSIDWATDCLGVQDINNEIEQKLMTIVDELVPLVEVESRKEGLANSPIVQNLKNKRKNLYRNAKRRICARLLTRCKDLDKKINIAMLNDKRRQVRQHIKNKDPATLWRAVKSAKDLPQSQLPKKLVDDHQFAESASMKAQMFADFFKGRISTLAARSKVEQFVYNGQRKLNIEEPLVFTHEEVLQEMKQLKDKKCYGMDRIPLKIIRDGAGVLCNPICNLLNKIVEQNVVPEQWLTARITPLHKKGKREFVKNYRPISNLCATSKVFEKLMIKRILEYESRAGVNLTGGGQHGFKKGKSTVTAGLEIQSKLARYLEEGKYSVMASLDLSSAFDVVDIDLLTYRLKRIGLPTEYVRLVKTWLSKRRAFVEVENEVSEVFRVDKVMHGANSFCTLHSTNSRTRRTGFLCR
jgi:hypothetical protein